MLQEPLLSQRLRALRGNFLTFGLPREDGNDRLCRGQAGTGICSSHWASREALGACRTMCSRHVSLPCAARLSPAPNCTGVEKLRPALPLPTNRNPWASLAKLLAGSKGDAEYFQANIKNSLSHGNGGGKKCWTHRVVNAGSKNTLSPSRELILIFTVKCWLLVK